MKMLDMLRHAIGLRSPLRLVYHYLRGLAAFALSGNPARDMYIIGVTGTKGKTTTSTLIAAALEQSGRNIALLSTAQIWMAGEKRENHSKMTMDSPFKLWKAIREAKEKGVTHLVLETSSHGIYYFRNFGIRYNAVVLTNISQDHLDLHGTMDHYARIKARIFKNETNKICVLPKDCEYFDLFLNTVQNAKCKMQNDESIKNSDIFPPDKGGEEEEGTLGGLATLVTYSMKTGATYQARGLKTDENGIEMLIHSIFPIAEEALITSKLVGVFNAENLLAAYATLRSIGIETKVMQVAWKDFTGVPGRLERVPNNRGVTVLVDYAHTEQSLKSVLQTLQVQSEKFKVQSGGIDDEFDSNGIKKPELGTLSAAADELGTQEPKLILVFGATGDRDTTKRPKMGTVAHELADMIVLTDDDTYTEPSANIIDMVKVGIPREIGDSFQIIPDRREAIRWAIQSAKKGDIVLIAGKGCETIQMTNNGPIPWSDRAIAEEFLA